MWEMLLSLRRLVRGDGPPHVAQWRCSVDTAVSVSAPKLISFLLPDELPYDLLVTLRNSFFQRTFAGIVTPADRLAADPFDPDVATLAESLATNLISTSARTRDQLYSLIQTYWREALLPYWPKIRAAVQADLSIRANKFAYDGIDGCLSQLHPLARWDAPVLEIPCRDSAGKDRDLDGRGMLLVPSFFCGTPPTALSDPALQPVLMFGVDRGLVDLNGGPARAGSPALGKLVGHTRAKVLATIVMSPATTTHLAGRVQPR